MGTPSATGLLGPGAASRLAKVVPGMLASVTVVPILLAGQRFGFVAAVPTPVLLGGVLFGVLAAISAALAWPPGTGRSAMRKRIAVCSTTIALVLYLVGWGAVLSIGLVFGMLEELRVEGSKAVRPAIVADVMVIAVGELLVAAGVFETLMPQPQGHGLAALVAFGACVIIGFLGFVYKEKETVEASLRRSEERLRALVQHASDAIVVIEADGTIEYASPAVLRLLGRVPQHLARLDSELVHLDHLDVARATFQDVLSHPGSVTWIELPLRHADGAYRWFEIGITNRLDDEAVGGLVCNMRDTTERRSAQEQLAFQAHHDALTHLPNRWLFLDRLDVAQRAARTTGRYVAVLFLDVDRFKLVNDSLGHEVGDRMLISVAERLKASLQPQDVVGRFGGDEFTLLLTDVAEPDVALRVADRVAAAMREPLVIDGHELFLSASIGVALSHAGADRPDDLLRQADLAMYVAKEKGRGHWELFDPTFAPHVMERLELEGDLWHALEHGELVVRFQPEVELATGRVIGTEALIRWMHPHRGVLQPASFVPLAEESSLIVAIDRYVLREACRWSRRWAESGPRGSPLVVSVNLSPRFMRQTDTVADIAEVLRETGVDPRTVQLEITERTALTELETACSQLHQLRALGVRVAIDDFGTGYSSLSYLKQFPIDVLKLDKSFVDGLDGTTTDIAIAQAIVTMGHALGMKVTAEGVERPAQAAQLRALGCDSAMGFLWSPALPPEELGSVADAGFLPEGGAHRGVVVPLRARA